MPDSETTLCLSLCGSASAGDKLLDILMELIDGPFEIGSVFTHGAAHGCLQGDEIVTGRAAAIQAQLLVRPAQLETVLARLRQELAGVGLRYWVTPVVTRGEIE